MAISRDMQSNSDGRILFRLLGEVADGEEGEEERRERREREKEEAAVRAAERKARLEANAAQHYEDRHGQRM